MSHPVNGSRLSLGEMHNLVVDHTIVMAVTKYGAPQKHDVYKVGCYQCHWVGHQNQLTLGGKTGQSSCCPKCFRQDVHYLEPDDLAGPFLIAREAK